MCNALRNREHQRNHIRPLNHALLYRVSDVVLKHTRQTISHFGIEHWCNDQSVII